MKMIFGAVILVGLGACAAPKTPSRSIDELLADPLALQSVLDRCQANASRAAGDIECANARQAVEKQAAAEDAAKASKKQEEFERLRDARRSADDRQQRDVDAAKKPFDPYSTPVNPDPAPPHR